MNPQHSQRRLMQVLLLSGDLIGLLIVFVAAQVARFQHLIMERHLTNLFSQGQFITVYLIFVISYYIFDLYEPRNWRSSLFDPLKIIFASMTAAVILFAWFYFVQSETRGVYGRGVMLLAIPGFTFYSLLFRFWVNRSLRRRQQKSEWLLLGNENSYQTLTKDWNRLRLEGLLEWHNIAAKFSTQEISLLLSRPWDGIIVDGVTDAQLSNSLMSARLSGQSILNIQGFYEFYCGKVPLHSLDNSWFAFTEGFSILHSQVSKRLKRIGDIFISATMLILLSPLLFILILLIRLESRGKSLYSQVRVGQSGRTFTMWKFRSMRENAEQSGAQWAAKNDNRVTHLGRFMRKTRLDELPQLVNILRGDMSFIGPRPERPEFTETLRQKIAFYDLRHLVKPGLTGWAQVMYPYGASEEDAYEKLQYDLFYIKNYSFGRDIEIVLKTVAVVLFGAGR